MPVLQRHSSRGSHRYLLSALRQQSFSFAMPGVWWRARERLEVLRELRAKRGVMKTQNSAKGIVFLSAVRTPFGTYGGALRDVSVTDFTVTAANAAIERAGIAPGDIESTT